MSKTVTETEPSVMLGFKKLSNQVYVQEGSGSGSDTPNPEHPSTVIIYGWGDARPRHVSKYVAGYRQLFPHAQIVLIFSPILKALYQTLEARSRTMIPVLETVYPEALTGAPTKQGGWGEEAGEAAKQADRRVLLHVMSNTGGLNCAATMNGYTSNTHGAVMPHQLMICDSTPGSTDFARNVGAWSKAMTVGAAGWFPWPAAFTQALAAVFVRGRVGGRGDERGRVQHAGGQRRAAVGYGGEAVVFVLQGGRDYSLG